MDFFKKSSKIFEKCSESSDSSRKLNTSKSIFSDTKWVKTRKNFQKWIFSKKAQNFLKNALNLLIHRENWKSQNQFFPIQNGLKHVKIFKNGFFQKKLKIFWKYSESSDSSRRLKITKSIFSHSKWVKTRKNFQKKNF